MRRFKEGTVAVYLHGVWIPVDLRVLTGRKADLSTAVEKGFTDEVVAQAFIETEQPKLRPARQRKFPVPHKTKKFRTKLYDELHELIKKHPGMTRRELEKKMGFRFPDSWAGAMQRRKLIRRVGQRVNARWYPVSKKSAGK